MAQDSTFRKPDGSTFELFDLLAGGFQSQIINDDINAKSYESDILHIQRRSEIAYGFEGQGAFRFVVVWTDVEGNPLFEDVATSESAKLSGVLPVRGEYAIIKLEDTSNVANMITGTYNIH